MPHICELFFPKILPDRNDVSNTETQSEEIGKGDVQVHGSQSDSDDESVNKDAQAGVQKIEATTSVWSKTHLILAYIL